jgi:hypothetical protein
MTRNGSAVAQLERIRQRAQLINGIADNADKARDYRGRPDAQFTEPECT